MANKLASGLRRARMAHGWTGERVAKALQMTAAAYRRYERGETEPSASTLLALAKIYNISLDQLAGVETKSATLVDSFQIEVKAGQVFKIEITGNVVNVTEKNKKLPELTICN